MNWSTINILELVIASFIMGMLSYRLLNIFFAKMKDVNAIKDINNQFKQILSNVISNKSKFVNRINSVVFIKTNLHDYGDVNIVYLLDKRSVSIFMEDKCIYTSDFADKEVINSIVETIDVKYEKNINDVVELLGFIFSREDFEKKFKVKIEDIKNGKMMDHQMESDINRIIQGNNTKLDMDEILDKISKVGIENLTEEEKNFLNNFNK